MAKTAGDLADYVPFSIEDLLSLAAKGQYYGGYVTGFLLEQAVAFWALTSATQGIGGVMQKAVLALKAGEWVAQFARATFYTLRSLAIILRADALVEGARLATAPLAKMLRKSADALTRLWTRYPRAGHIVERIGKVARGSMLTAERTLYWLSFPERMADEAVLRFVRFAEKQGNEALDHWMTRWTVQQNASRSIKWGQ